MGIPRCTDSSSPSLRPARAAIAEPDVPSLGEVSDGSAPREGTSGFAMAAGEGGSDVLELFEQRGIPIELHGVDTLIASCARTDTDGIRAIVEREPHLVNEVLAMGGTLLAKFAGTGNPPGVRQLLDL